MACQGKQRILYNKFQITGILTLMVNGLRAANFQTAIHFLYSPEIRSNNIENNWKSYQKTRNLLFNESEYPIVSFMPFCASIVYA